MSKNRRRGPSGIPIASEVPRSAESRRHPPSFTKGGNSRRGVHAMAGRATNEPEAFFRSAIAALSRVLHPRGYTLTNEEAHPQAFGSQLCEFSGPTPVRLV